MAVQPDNADPDSGVTAQAAGGPADWPRHSVPAKLHLTARSSRTFFEERLAEAGASFATWTVLAALKAQGPMIQRALAQYLGIEGPTLSRHLEALERRGLIARAREGADRRAVNVELTAEGTELHARIAMVAVSSQQRMLRNLTDEEIAQLQSLLDRILDNVSYGGDPHP